MLTPIPSPERDLSLRIKESGLPIVRPDPNKIAVLINKNAKQVNDRMAKRMERIIGRENFFYSRNLEEAEAFTREIVQRGYGTILSGGGDGTLCNTVNMVRKYIEESNAWRIKRYQQHGDAQDLLGTPRFGFLRLGTGNGISTVVGAKGALSDLRTIVDFAPGRTHEIPLVEWENQRFFFGGLGYDSMILNDYNTLKNRSDNILLRLLMHGVTGYLFAALARTAPRMLFQNPKVEGRISTEHTAYYIDPRRGDAAIAMDPGILFEGLSTMVSVGSSPFYGYGFRMFPFANIRPGYMHLRITNIGPLTAVAHMRSLWRGTYRNPEHIFDFLVKDVRVELDKPFPFQHSGDAQGMRNDLTLRVSEEPLRLVDCHAPLLRS